MEEAAHRGLNPLSELSRSDFNTGTYICEDSQTTASRSATTGGCPPMLKLFMIGIKIKIKKQFAIQNDNGPRSSPSSSFRSCCVSVVLSFVLRVFVVLEHGPRSDTGT